MNRRHFLKCLLAAGAYQMGAPLLGRETRDSAAFSVESLEALRGKLTLYLGRGEGGLYENILDAIRARNPGFTLDVRRAPSSALANTIVAEASAKNIRPDVFWAIDAGSIGRVVNHAPVEPLPEPLYDALQPTYRFRDWAPISGRIRTLPYNTERFRSSDIPTSIQELADSDLRVAWAPAYGAFQSFVTAMRLLEGNEQTRKWLQAVRQRATSYAGEFGVVMAVARGEADVGLANHYYTLRLKKGRPDSPVALAFTQNDAGCLLNASGALLLNKDPLSTRFVQTLLTREVQSYLAREAYEIPLVEGISPPEGLPDLSEIRPPTLDLERLGEVTPTLNLLRETGIL